MEDRSLFFYLVLIGFQGGEENVSRYLRNFCLVYAKFCIEFLLVTNTYKLAAIKLKIESVHFCKM